MTDTVTVARKELREIVGGGSGRRWMIRETIFVGIFGVFFPLMQPEAWRSGAVPAVFFLLIPLFIAGPHVADSFAGERERKTLETLLATRLPDGAIYRGKILAACLYAWAVCLVIVATSLVALNFLGRGGGFFFYSAPVWMATGVGSFLSALFIAGIGTFVSLRAQTVRAAHQAMMLPLFIVIFGGSLGLPVLFQALPTASQVALAEWASQVSAVQALAGLLTLLLAADVFLVWLGLRRFRRDRLVADS